ncbi:MAG: hypothetical protein JWM11_7646 [Planctomycetaceae bacterium]|nr:hypothetical protein [Planctomycetaceae bacterium]
MAHIISPGSAYSSSHADHRPRPFFLVDIFQRYGAKAAVALVIAASVAFAPLMTLYWFNELSSQSVVALEFGQSVVVKPGRYEQDQSRDEPGETALLQVVCEVPTSDGWRRLLVDDDPVRRDVQTSDSNFVRRELAYLRRAGNSKLPFGLLGKPPVSAWLPAGDYEVLVIHEAPQADFSVSARPLAYPLISAVAYPSLEPRVKTVCRIPLPHYNWGGSEPVKLLGAAGPVENRALKTEDLASLLPTYEATFPIPTPAGFLLSLPEPKIQHTDGHRDCVADLRELQMVPREWSRNQLAAVRNWLPDDAVQARANLSQLVDRLQWFEFLEGWFCYACAAVAGLVFTKWGTLTLLDPGRRRNAWNKSPSVLLKIAIVSAVIWFLYQYLMNPSGIYNLLPSQSNLTR